MRGLPVASIGGAVADKSGGSINPGRHRAERRANLRVRDVLRIIVGAIREGVLEGVGELLAIAVVVGAYVGLTALYRHDPTIAIAAIAGIALVIGVGVASLWVRRQPSLSSAERLVRGFAVGAGVVAVTALIAFLPVYLADMALGWLG
jgi:hypothetical protein